MRISPVSVQPSYFNYTYQAEKISSSPGKNDVVTLSDEGKKMAALGSANSSLLIDTEINFMDGAGKDGVITLDEIRAFSEKKFNAAKDILAETLSQLGIPSGSSITIGTDEEGVFRVDSDLSAQDNDRLETALNEHSDFQQAFMKSSSSFSLLDAGEKHTEFSQAYAQDPMAAVARYGIGNPSSGEYVIQYAQGQTIQVLKTI